jgi:cytochrome c-type biogenesis protein CcmH/NrfG
MRRARHARRPVVPGDDPRREAGRVMFPLLAAALACVIYLNALDNPFVYDDHDTVVANPSLTDLSNVRFLIAYAPFRPVVNLSYALDRWLWGTRAFGYHLTNVILHAINTVLLYLFIGGLLEDWERRRGQVEIRGGRAIRFAAFASAAVFAAHPLLTEAVGYVSGRSEVLCAAFFLTACLLGRRAIRTRSRAAGAGAIAAGLLAAGSKETAAALPLVLLAYDWLLRPGSENGRVQRLWRVFVPVMMVLVIGGLYRVFVYAGTRPAAADPLNLLTQARVIWRYVGLFVWPAGQSIVHDIARSITFADPVAWLAVAGIVFLVAGALAVRKSWPLVSLGVLWFLAALAPSSTFVVLREPMAEHRVYLAASGVVLVIAIGVRGALEHGSASMRKGMLTAVPAVLIVLSLLTVMRNNVWASPVWLWSEAAERAPAMWEPHYALADALREAGDCNAAALEYRRVVTINSEYRDAYTNLGICLARTQQFDEAEASFRRALEIDPGFARGYTNLAALALVRGDAERARSFYGEAIVRDPNNVLARMQLAKLYEQTFHDYHAAARMCGEARLIAPATPGVVECVERNQRLAAAKDTGR